MTKTTLCPFSLIWALALASSATADGIADWLNSIQAANPGYVKTNILRPYHDDIGNYSVATGGGITYEFIYNANVGGPSSALMGAGYLAGSPTSDPAGLKLEQYENTGKFGVTLFGVEDFSFPTDTIFNTDTHAVFVLDGTNATLYVNGILGGSVNVQVAPAGLTLAGIVGIGQVYDNSSGTSFDTMSGRILGVAVYDSALSPETIRGHYDAFAVPEPSALILVSLGLCSLARTGGRRGVRCC